MRALFKTERLALEARFEDSLYSAEMIKHWEECRIKLNREPFEAIVRTFDSDGKVHEIPAKGPGKILRYCSYHQLIHEAEKQPKSDDAFEGMLVRVADADSATPPEECCLKPKRQEDYAEWTKEWKNSPFYFSFMDKFVSKARLMTEVKSVACFGLGELKQDTDRSPYDHIIANYLQHIVALEIRNWLAFKQKMEPKNIPIYAQDPKYCTNCKDILENELGFQVVEGNSGFLNVDGNTFVVTSAPTVPVRQIVGDLTKGVGGPAGFLCQPIDGDGVEASDGIVDMPSRNLYQFAVAATRNHMMAVWRTERDDSSDEESDVTNSVYYDEQYPVVKASIFPDFAIYLKKSQS